jgi:phosphoglycerol transferase
MSKGSSKKGVLLKVLSVLSAVLLLVSLLVFFAAKWYITTYGDLGFESILFTLFSGLNGVQSGLVGDYLVYGFLPAIVLFAVFCLVIFFTSKRKIVVTLFNKLKIRLYPLHHAVKIVVAFVLTVVLTVSGLNSVRFFEYVKRQLDSTAIFEQEYVDPLSVDIQFPEQKQNLIYIFIESLETTYFSKVHGGASNEELMPELYELAKTNVNFSTTDGVGGYSAVLGTTWTAGAMVAHTSGLPLKVPVGFDDNTYGKDAFLPGANTLMNVLADNGYYQALMVGSDATFANRAVYYNTHKINKIYDYFTAQDDGIIPEDYFAWWGMEDKYLYEYAKQELLEISADDTPFAFTMLTVDTHHIGGYMCEYCQSTYPEQYQNVISCASRQLSAFLDWLSEQEFFKNTTVVICGDHPTMDEGYISRNVQKDYVRTVYNCILNSKASTDNTKNRQFSAMDMLPTTLAAMGCTIEGDRLGLGTNLFSDKTTLAEEMGTEAFSNELAKASQYYTDRFIYGN